MGGWALRASSLKLTSTPNQRSGYISGKHIVCIGGGGLFLSCGDSGRMFDHLFIAYVGFVVVVVVVLSGLARGH